MKLIIKTFAAILIIALVSSNALALGITPGRTTLDFEPGKIHNGKLKIVNNEDKDISLIVYQRGTLKDYIELPESSLTLDKGSSKEIPFILKLPEELENPGLNTADIVVRELSSNIEEEEITVGSLTAVSHQVHVYVPVPGKFIQPQLNIVGEGSTVNFYLPIVNRGEEDIKELKATIFIQENGEQTDKIESEAISLKSKEKTELNLKWMNEVYGNYRAVVLITFDDQVAKIESDFFIGDFFIKPLDISVKNFQLGEVAKFNTLVENIANEKVGDFTTEIIFYDVEESLIADIKSQPIDVEAKAKKESISFLDTENVEEGSYRGTLRLKYQDKVSEKQLKTIIEKNKIQIEIVGITGLVVSETKQQQNKTIRVLFILLILINASWIWYFKKRKKTQLQNQNV